MSCPEPCNLWIWWHVTLMTRLCWPRQGHLGGSSVTVGTVKSRSYFQLVAEEKERFEPQEEFNVLLLAWRWKSHVKSNTDALSSWERPLGYSQQGNGASVLQLQGAGFCRQPEWVWKLTSLQEGSSLNSDKGSRASWQHSVCGSTILRGLGNKGCILTLRSW